MVLERDGYGFDAVDGEESTIPAEVSASTSTDDVLPVLDGL